MTALAYAVRDSTTMLRRDVTHAMRYPAMTISGMMVPLFFLLMFVGVFGNTMHAGLMGASIGGGHYIEYVAPGIIVMTSAAGASMTALGICTDMNEGIIARFRTMAITRSSVLTGKVLGSLIRTLISGVVVIAAALALGFRPSASPLEWAAATGLFALLTLAITWLAVAFGLVAKTVEGANSLALLVLVLPFVSSAFVPTRSMPAGVRWFAENQPFTPVINTFRGLFSGTPIGHNAILAASWCVGFTLLGYLWASRRYDRSPV
jgi:ABC-2 type transport system permease protein